MSEEIKVEDKPKVKKKFLEGFFLKLKKIKHLDVVLTVLFIAVILLIYFSTFSQSNQGTGQSGEKAKESTEITSSILAYTSELEEKLRSTLSAINGAGKVNVMISFSDGIETFIAYSTEVKTLADGTQIEVKTPILVTNDGKSQPIVLKTVMPSPSNVIVVATGAQNTNVKLEILRAVQTMFGLSNSNIEIFAGN